MEEFIVNNTFKRVQHAVYSTPLGVLYSWLIVALAVAIIIAGCSDNNTGTNGGGSYPYICTNGTAADGSTDTQNVQKCTSCNSGYRLNSNTCQLTIAKSIVVTRSYTCAILDNNTLKCWGFGTRGWLGYGNTTTLNAPTNAVINLGVNRTAKAISAKSSHTCAILDNNTVKCWGEGNNGQLGYGNANDTNAPSNTAINLGSNRTAKAISAQENHTCAILDNNTVKCWGISNNGQLGYGDTTQRNEPSSDAINLGDGRTAKAIDTGLQHTCAILDNNTLKCWGNNNFGQLGYGDTTRRNEPSSDAINLGDSRTVKAISAGEFHTCAILDNNTLKCWGLNNNGQLGYDNTNNLNEPASAAVDLGDNRTAKAISMGWRYTCALLDNNTLKCWGNNDSGQLGYGDITQRTEPSSDAINLGDGRIAKAISAGESHTCAILDNNTLKCWGSGANGRLGYGDTTQRTEPSSDSINLEGN